MTNEHDAGALDRVVERLRRSDFTLTQDVSYLNHASFGPVPVASAAAAGAGLKLMSGSDLGNMVGLVMEKADSVRRLAGVLLNCSPDDVALLHNTSEGLNLAAQGLSWHEADEVISYELEHPNAVFPWRNLEAQGVRVRYIKDRGHRFDAADVADLVNDRTRVVCLSLVNFASGFRAPLEDVGRICQDRGLWFVIDGIQAVGALRVDVQALGADIVAAHCYKWLLSGLGIALVYCSERARNELNVPQPGWFGRVNPADLATLSDFDLNLTRSARRFEASEPNLPGLFALETSLSTMLALGPDAIQARVLDLVEKLSEGLETRGYRVLSSRRAREGSGIVSFSSPGRPIDAVADSLRSHAVIASLRQGAIRLAPHFYNNQDDLDRFFAALPA